MTHISKIHYLCPNKHAQTMLNALRTRTFLFLISLCVPLLMTAQTAAPPTTIEGWADRLARFGKGLPQEKVFVHMDNTCYFLGDTIWYSVFTRRTDKGTPSNVSRVLYVELLNQDGFLVERQLVEMKNGRGHGNFALANTLYGGFYELRAYTRWQLNWGLTEKEHTSFAEDWFFNNRMAKEFYRDYEKLYSRVFPVYDKPEEPGDFYHNMTTRPLRRYFKSGAAQPQPQLSFYPEGGHLVAGVPCRVAFEAATEAGEALEGTLEILKKGNIETLKDAQGQDAQSVAAVSRGRGAFLFTPAADQRYTARFTSKDGKTVEAEIKDAEADGVALSVQRQGDEWLISVAAQGLAAQKALGLTVMHEGHVILFEDIKSPAAQIHYTPLSTREGHGGESGVHQATVFDADGRVWADRLFFVTKPEMLQPSLAVSGVKEQYAPYERVNLTVACPAMPSQSVSLAVRDAATEDYTYDTGNILTEMLLSSEVKGFIPDAAYFFKADDEEHRTALDLLMMTQGWRRFDWHAMATPGAFALTEPAETQTQILRGEVLNYAASILQDEQAALDFSCPTPFNMEKQLEHHTDYQDFRDKLQQVTQDDLSTEDKYAGMGQSEVLETIIAESYARESNFPPGSYRMRSNIATSRFNAKERPLGKEVRVHAEFTQPGSESILGDMETSNGSFTIPSPHFNGFCVFFLAASDTTKWKPKKPHTWVVMDESEDAEFYVRMHWPYPHFTQPYSYYQMAYRQPPSDSPQASQVSLFNPKTFETDMQTVTVHASKSGMRKLDLSKPAFSVDAYEAYNAACDAGLMSGCYRGRFHFLNSIARLYAGDMQTNNAYLLEARYDGANLSRNITPNQVNRYNKLTYLNRVNLYTDYNPRTGGDPRAKEDEVERLAVDLRQMSDEGQRVTYRDRRYILQGFNEPDDFYHPNYQLAPDATAPKDYRRTLYWNPDLQLDASGAATVSFYTGSKATSIVVDANGQAADGTLITSP